MLSVSSGQMAKAGTLYERYKTKMYNYFRKMNMEAQLAEDMTQEVFERMIKYRSSYNAEYPFAPWLYRIASNVRQDHYRKNKISMYAIGDQEERIEHDPGPLAEQIDQEQKLHKAIASLPEEQREILVLCKLQKQKYAQVAMMKNTTETNVKTTVHRSIKKLRKYYQEMNWL